MISLAEILNSRVLIVDDQEVNVLLLERALRAAGYACITSTTDPCRVCELHAEHRYDLILLDLQMPRMDGFQVMERLKGVDPEGYLSVLVITATPSHKLRALEAGARDFISKPFEIPEVLARVRNLLEVRLSQRRLRSQNDVLEERVRERTRDLRESYLETILAMTRAVEHKDEDTGAHVQRIGHYSRALASSLGLDEEFVDRVFIASPMHDVGKICIPDHILLKPGLLTPAEMQVMESHTVIGARILGNSRSPYLAMGAEIALNHHESWDGRGYPHGKRGEAIPLSARIMNICDVYDALRSKRPYKPALGHLDSVRIITHGDGRTHPRQFDPDIAAAFARHHESFRDIFAAYEKSKPVRLLNDSRGARAGRAAEQVAALQ